MKLFSRRFLLFFSLLLLIELAFRVKYSTSLNYWSSFAYKPDTAIGYRYLPNSTGIHRNSVYSRNYSINSIGYPGKEYNLQKKRGTIRIIVVGTSDDTGLSTNGIENYVNITNNMFAKTKYTVEILNFSIDGNNKILTNIKIILRECIKYNPDLILLREEFPIVKRFRMRETYNGIIINYANPMTNLDSAKKFIDNEILTRNFQQRLLDNSYIYRGITKYSINHQKDNDFTKAVVKLLYPNMKVVKGYVRRNLDWSIPNDTADYKPITLTEEKSIEILKSVTDTLNRRKVKLFLFSTYQDDKIDYSDLYLKNGINYLPLNVVRRSEYTFGEEDGHSSQEGHKAIAQALFMKLKVIFMRSYNNY